MIAWNALAHAGEGGNLKDVFVAQDRSSAWKQSREAFLGPAHPLLGCWLSWFTVGHPSGAVGHDPCS